MVRVAGILLVLGGILSCGGGGGGGTTTTPPAITSQPSNQTVTAGQGASFTVSATGTAPLAYQWRKNGTHLGGATAATYAIASTVAGDAGTYDVVVSNAAGAVTSAGAVLTVNPAPVPPTITGQPAALTVTAGQGASFAVTAIGTAPLSYQWRKNGLNLAGATAATYAIAATTTGDAGTYDVVVSNTAGHATSTGAALTVNPAPVAPAITGQPSNLTVTAGQGATFTVTATGTAPLSYQWRKGGSPIGGATAATYSIASTVAGDAGTYDVVVTNTAGTATSSGAVLTVNPVPGLDLSIDGLYLTQAAQSYTGTVPLLKDRSAFLRVFVKASQANTATPQVRVRIYNGASVLQTYTLNAPGAAVPTSIAEGTLNSSWNQLIPGTLIQPGYSILADVDPGHAVAESDEANNSFPASGTPQALAVQTVPTWRVTIIPVTQSGLTGNATAGNLATWTDRLARMMPVVAVDSALGSGYTTTSALASGGAGWGTLLSEIEAKRVADGVQTTRYYYGAVATSYGSGVAGLGYVPGSAASSSGRSAIGWDKTGYSDGGNYPEVFAHEMGHTFGRSHAPCGGPDGVDPGYPYPAGNIGTYGYDVTNGVLKDKTTSTDVMAYCSPVWISDYTFKSVTTWRQASAVGLEPEARTETQEGLLVWGRKEKGLWILEPAFRISGRPAAGVGSHQVEALDAADRSLGSISVEPVAVADGADPDEVHFAAFLPLEAAGFEALRSLRLERGADLLAQQSAGTGAAFGARPASLRQVEAGLELRWSPLLHRAVLVRDAMTGQVLAIGRDGLLNLPSAAAELDLVFSDGVRSEVRRMRPEPR